MGGFCKFFHRNIMYNRNIMYKWYVVHKTLCTNRNTGILCKNIIYKQKNM